MKAFLFGLLLFSYSAYGQNPYQRNLPLRVVAKPVAPVLRSYPTYVRPEETIPGARITLGPSLGFYNGVKGYGGLGEISFSTGTPVYLGIQSGYLQFEQNSSTSLSKLTSIPLLASVIYRFSSPKATVHP